MTHLGFGVWGTPLSWGQVGGVMLVLRSFPQLAGRSVENLVEIYKSDCLYLCSLFTPEPPDQSPPNFAQTSHQLREGS